VVFKGFSQKFLTRLSGLFKTAFLGLTYGHLLPKLQLSLLLSRIITNARTNLQVGLILWDIQRSGMPRIVWGTWGRRIARSVWRGRSSSCLVGKIVYPSMRVSLSSSRQTDMSDIQILGEMEMQHWNSSRMSLGSLAPVNYLSTLLTCKHKMQNYVYSSKYYISKTQTIKIKLLNTGLHLYICITDEACVWQNYVKHIMFYNSYLDRLMIT